MMAVLALTASPTIHAAANDMFECEVKQVSRVNETGTQQTAKDHYAKSYLLGAKFFVNRTTGVITGKDISNDKYKNQVLADGRTLQNPLTIISSYASNREDGANATYFLVVNTHVAGRKKTFFMKGMNAELMSGICQ